MNLASPKIIKELLSKYKTRAFKGWGQNFLVNRGILKKIIDSADLNPNDVVLEVGPGLGILTQGLAKKVKMVIAVEKDKKLCEILKSVLSDIGAKNVKIINADILKLKIKELIRGCKPEVESYKVVANIPYYLTSRLIRSLLELPTPPACLILTIQKEVAQRICAKPPRMNLLAVCVQFYAETKIISYISKNCFWPTPKVDSAIIKITPRKTPLPVLAENFFKVVKAGFSHPRKQIVGNLSNGLKINKEKISACLIKNKIDPSQRAETLSIKDWKNLSVLLK